MSEEKVVVTLSDFEQRVLVKGMSEYRNDLIEDGKPTEEIGRASCRERV